MLTKIGSTGLILMITAMGMAQSQVKLPECRIDLAGQGTPKVGMVYENGSTGVTGANADWLKADMDKRLVISAPVTTTWQTFEFSFTPKISGEVELMLMANIAAKRYLVWFDSLKVSGAVINNGDMEKLDAKEQPQGWNQFGSPKIATDGQANDGKVYVKVSHDRRFTQRLKVEQGKTVTVTFSARTGEPLEIDTAK